MTKSIQLWLTREEIVLLTAASDELYEKIAGTYGDDTLNSARQKLSKALTKADNKEKE